MITRATLDAAAFAPFGTLIEYRDAGGRLHLTTALRNLRPDAAANLDFLRAPAATLPLAATLMERHQFSAQCFVPIDVARYAVLVAPDAAAGGPDMARALLFVARGDQCITYAPNTWHHPLAPLDRDGLFAILIWRDGGAADTEFFTLPGPIGLDLG